MKKKQVRDLQPGMITGEDIFAIDGQLILPKKVILNEKNIEKLISFSIFSIKVEDEMASEDDMLSDEPSYSEKIKSNPDFRAFKASFEKSVDTLKDGLNQIADANSDFEPKTLIADTLKLVSMSERSSISAMDMLLNMRDYDDSTYTHCINTAIICNIFAGWLKMSQAEQVLATSCGLFHDIGKLKVPEEILKKPSDLTKVECDAIKRHTLDGYNILNRQNLHDEIKNTALMHHEKCDGSGYPYGFSGEKLSKYTKLVTIVDNYDAMTSNRIYRKAICPFDAIEIMEKERFAKYDADMIMTFLSNVSNSFIGNRVRLDNGLEGEVIFINPTHYGRPTIKCGAKFIDLSTHTDVKIAAII